MNHENRQAARTAPSLLASASRILSLISDCFDLPTGVQALTPMFVHSAILEAQNLIAEAESAVSPLALPLASYAAGDAAAEAENVESDAEASAAQLEVRRATWHLPPLAPSAPPFFLRTSHSLAEKPDEVEQVSQKQENGPAASYEEFARRVVNEIPIANKPEQHRDALRDGEALAEHYRRRMAR